MKDRAATTFNTDEKTPLVDKQVNASDDYLQQSFISDTLIPSNQSLYDALEQRGYLSRPILKDWGMFVVPEGNLGLVMDNGRPLFLAPGRHTLWSPFAERMGIVPISSKQINLGSIQIVTINQGELGLSVKNGENIILEPGRYFLESPHQFVKSEKANQNHLVLGTHRRITVPVGHVAIASDDGKQIIISEKDTTKGPYITNSPTFSFDPATGFQSIQIQSREVNNLTVNTKDGIPIKIEGLITYEITEPRTAFLKMKDVHKTIYDQAESTLTTVFSHLTMKDIAPSLSAHEKVSLKQKEKVDEDKDFIEKATESFLEKFDEKARSWGVSLSLNIEKMEFVDKQYTEMIRARATKSVEAETNSSIVDSTNEVEQKKEENKGRLKIIAAKAEAQAIKEIAMAKLFAAEQEAKAAAMLSEQPLAGQLAVLKAQAEIVRGMGNNAVFMPHDISLSDTAYRSSQGHTLFGRQRHENIVRSIDLEEGISQRRAFGHTKA